ncbi:porin family protein [Aequorivita viscosa]|uniref:Outer membrane autotransporter barrel domain-containing protein n=1 Tax=Aequorivita viscosa TaxID=797419 RepID=A0A1M6N401_9FLAO|nr:porin family protein [Aequorivita viscosa]SDX41576.1 outer membrane autotransporter barrel domain-containing protein [Aequorivita viscosa]SHJ90417.1 outer membrane autotransporter barrel domain-containing protein [Aequorivita viscosa]
MKKLLLVAAFAVFAFSTTQAQEVRLGAKAGINVASLGGDTAGNLSLGARTSFHIGVLAEIPLAGKFAIQPELLYSSEGSDFSSFGSSYDLKLDYIRIPVLAKYYIIEGLSAELGPNFGVLVSAKADDVDVKDGTNSFDVGLGVGASYRLNMGVFFSLRYNKGFMNVNDSDTFKQQSNVFQISAGYSF